VTRTVMGFSNWLANFVIISSEYGTPNVQILLYRMTQFFPFYKKAETGKRKSTVCYSILYNECISVLQDRTYHNIIIQVYIYTDEHRE